MPGCAENPVRISVITPLGRPYLAGVSAQCVALQKHRDIEHIIVGGSHGKVGEEDYYNKVAVGIEAAKGAVIAIFEDDDYYYPDWLQYAASQIWLGAEVVGCGWSRVYNLNYRRFVERKKVVQGPFAGTVVFSREVIGEFIGACREHHPFKAIAKSLKLKQPDRNYLVAMKGIPGGAVGVSNQDNRWHDQEDLYPSADLSLSVLREWIGREMLDAYAPALRKLRHQVPA